MGKYASIVIATVVVVVLSVLLVLSDEALFGAAVFVLGMLGVVVLYQRQEAGRQAPSTDKGGKSKLDEALESRSSTETAPSPLAPGAPSAGGLPTWSPTSLGPWTPPATEPPARPTIREPEPSPSAWDPWARSYDTGPADEYDDENPLAALDRLDEIDPIAEVERLEGLGGAPTGGSADVTDSPSIAESRSRAFSFSSAPPVINEAAVRTDDDIMAASQATELHVNAGANSELARLLAKVQARLAAYE